MRTKTQKLFKIITQLVPIHWENIYDFLIKLIMSLKLSFCAKFTREKMRHTTCPDISGERKSLVIFSLCENPGFL